MLSSSSGQIATTTTGPGGVSSTVAVLPISGAGSVSNVSIVGGTIDATTSAVAGLAQPITNQTQAILVVRSEATGIQTMTTLNGYWSAGLTLS
jgi:hypothetical protein